MSILYDQEDRALLNVVNEVLNKDKSLLSTGKQFYPYFHPHGIKEMAESRWVRLATSVVYLLDSLEGGKVDDRLMALRCLRDELLTTAEGPLPKNTARVLLEIIKELARSRDDYHKQLKLARDFRIAMSGKPRIIRELLERYHLLEMPERWNQITFDDHVHDANTKGRKSATHLIMDAWIKGIRFLKVVYYNYIRPRSAAELLDAAKIMGLHVRIGIEFPVRYRSQYAQLIWAPRGFPDSQSFLCFLAEKEVMAFMDEGKKVSEYQEQYTLKIFQAFNERHRLNINEKYGLNLLPLDMAEFRRSVIAGHLSILHLARFIFVKMLPIMRRRVSELTLKYAEAEPDEKVLIEQLVLDMNRMDLEVIADRYLSPGNNREIPDPSTPSDNQDLPDFLKLKPNEMLKKLTSLYSNYRITLNLSNLRVEDVLELLYDCDGAINRLEIFNLKDYAKGKSDHIPDIIELQNALNSYYMSFGNVIALKRIIRNILARLQQSDYSDRKDRIQKVTSILHDIVTLRDMYKARPLKSRIGSDSTGQSPRFHGMGLAIMDTLPRKTQIHFKKYGKFKHDILPFYAGVQFRSIYLPNHESAGLSRTLLTLPAGLLLNRFIRQKRKEDWFVHDEKIKMVKQGNIVTLGGVEDEHDNGFSLAGQQQVRSSSDFSWRYLNSGIKNTLKVLLGFIPAFATFAYLYDWWLLAYCGACIWFSITGLRNIVQSVLGGGGFRRSPLLRWNDYVCWDRVSDSLMYTGFSVPLLDLLVKNIILDQHFNINTSTDPIKLYSIMAITNGIYITSHNIFRGLPAMAAFGNFFRSILSIPLAIVFNSLFGHILLLFQVPSVNDTLQKWAAIISKLSSDCVAGIIEGAADRQRNMEHRFRDYDNKFSQLFEVYAELEILYPEEQVQEIFTCAKQFSRSKTSDAQDLQTILIINALDQLYFWLYQPRSRTCLKQFIQKLSDEERQVFFNSQLILQRHKEISLLFVNGIVGNNFMKALAFYLDRSEGYLKSIRRLT